MYFLWNLSQFEENPDYGTKFDQENMSDKNLVEVNIKII